jgi:hypothetical protein
MRVFKEVVVSRCGCDEPHSYNVATRTSRIPTRYTARVLTASFTLLHDGAHPAD